MTLAILGTILWLLLIFVALSTFLPMTKLPYGFVQGIGFFRLQTLVLTILIAVVAVMSFEGAHRIWLVALAVVLTLVNSIYIAKFTPIWRVQSHKPDGAISDIDKRTVSILASNVKMSNRAYHRFNQMVRDEAPDILIVVEVDQPWLDGIEEIKSLFAEKIEVPFDTGYGMALYSRFPLGQVDVAELVTEGVPSIRAAVQLPAGSWFRIFAVHPEPPVPNMDTKGRDSEIALAGLKAQSDSLPVVIAGDLNDVAWSTTTRRFQRLSGLLDPRIGRGFYATFHAMIPCFRWPLDHLFHDAKFRLLDMRRLAPIGSDHFPMFFSLALTETEGDNVLPEPPRNGEKEEVDEMIDDAKAEERAPIGTEWEKD